jgi:hypothetical protein
LPYLGNPLSTMDFPVDYFTGDGTSTTFQLSRIPASATSILVHIGGVKQVASTTDPAYYLDGSKLVFVSPPGAYSPIEVNYLGIAGQVNIPGVQSVTQDMLSLQLANTFVYQTTANGATASFTLNAPPVSANSLVVSANGVIQHDYSVNSNTLTFGFTPPSGTFIRITSLALAQAGVPADGSVTSVKLGANLTITGNTTFDSFSGNPARIRGDFNNGTFANRLSFENASANSQSVVQTVPTGTSQTSGWLAFGNSNTANSSFALVADSVGSVTIRADRTGTATYEPMTFFTSGSERMRIDTSGRLLIGLSTSGSTTSRLQVTGGTTNATNLATSYSDAAVAFVPKSSSGFSLAVGSGTSDFPQLQVSANGAAAGDLLLQPYGGNVGIATSSPSTFGKFAVQGASSNRVFYADALAQPVARYDDNSFVINGLTIRNTGITGSNQGIGLLFQLGASGTPVSAGVIQMRSEGDFSTGSTQDAAMTFGTCLDGTATERMRIDSSGNLLIGTTTNTGKLVAALGGGHVFNVELNGTTLGSSNGVLVGNYLNQTTRLSAINFAADSSTAGSLVFGTATSSTIAERMRITSGGSVGIATTSPVASLEIYKANSTTGSQTDTSLMLSTSATTGRKVNIGFGLGGGVANTLAATIGYDVTNGAGAGLGDIFFSTRNTTADSVPTERMRITSAGNMQLSTAGTSILNSAGLPILRQSGSILQVVTNFPTSGAFYSQAVGSYAEITTAYRTSITPVSTNSILILEWVGLVGGNASGNISTMKFYDVTNNADVGLSGISLGSRGIGHGSFRQIDGDNNDRDNFIMRVIVPNSSTTARTYSIFHYSENSTTKFFNATSTDNNGCSYVKWHFTITEIAA